MRVFGFLFIVVLIVAAIGFFQGWFSVRTTHAGGKTGVELEVDKDKMTNDTKAAADQVGRLGTKAAEAVKSLGRKVGPKESELEGSITAIDAAARNITVTTGRTSMELHVPPEVPVTREGAAVGFDDLHTGNRVRLSVKHTGEDLHLTGITLLP